MQLPDGTWTYNEIQVNLSPFVALKSDKKRGHGAFDTARIMQAFTAETVVYTGGPSPGLWDNVAAGVYLELDLAGSELTAENMVGAAGAVESTNCRLDAVSFGACGAAPTTLEGFPDIVGVSIALVVAGCGSLRQLDVTGTKMSDTGVDYVAAAVADSAWLNDEGLVDPARRVKPRVDVQKGKFAVLEGPLSSMMLMHVLASFGLKLEDTGWSLNSKGITEADCVWIAAAIAKSTSLQSIDLSHNPIGDAGATALAEGIAKSTSLQKIDLRGNSVGDAGATALAAGIAKSTSLQHIDLGFLSSIGDAGRAALATVEKSGLKIEYRW